MQQKILLSHYTFNGLSFISLIEKTMSFLFHGTGQKNLSTSVDINAHVEKRGYLAKKKNMKKRYYVLKKRESDALPARLECYESEKKFLEGNQPKKKYILKDCFNISNISRKTDKNDQYQYVIALYINKDCIALVAETEEEMQDWLKLLKLHKNSNPHNPNLKIEYEHVWQVEVLPRSLALNQDLTGQHFLCLTNWFLSLVRVSDPTIKQEFELSSIRKCGTYDQFFLLVLGRYSGIGSGELFLQTEDSFIAQNIYHSVCSAMSNFGRMMHSSDGNIRQRTISDPHPDFPIGEGRVRSDSVPSGRKNLSSRKGHTCPSLEMIQQQSSETLDSLRLSSRFQEFKNHIPERNTTETGDNLSNYLDMGAKGKSNSSTVTSPRGILGELQGSPDNVYVEFPTELEIGERNVPTILNISSRTNPSSHTEVLSNVCSALQGMSSPVSPSVGSMTQWRTGSVGTPSPSQTSSAAHSRNASLLDESYVAMTSPGLAKSGTSSPYLDMGPGHIANIAQAERPRSISTPTPIPSPSDEDSYEMGQSGSSSCASGTPSDTRIHDLAGEERGDTPHSCGGLWGNSLSPNYIEDSECVAGPRSLRTNSVGSKPDQFKRKNRLDGAVPVGESARVRAFSVGSRVSLKLGVGRHGCGSAHHGAEHPTGGLGEIFPSIKECGKQAKSKSSSAPMLGASPISHSWSGTPGSHFRGLIQNRNALRESNLMELDFSKNRSCDYIPSEDKEKEKERKTSKERLWNTFTGHRQRSNSKSSGGSNHGVKEKRTSESENSSRGLDIPYIPIDRNDYLELDFTPSPRSSNNDPMKGYLPMHPPLSSSLKTTSEFIMDIRGPRTSSFSEGNHDMSSSLSSCASNDGYVDMTRGGASNGGLTIASSSSSSNSINTPPIGGGGSRPRRISSSICTPVMSSQELPSPMEDFVKGEEIEACLGELRKSKKKGSKRRSFRDGSKKKKNDSGGGGGGDSPEVQSKIKSQGPFATLTNLIIRKPNSSSNASSNALKTPLSPKGSPLPPKINNKDSTSPFSSLTRSKSKGKDLFNDIGEEKEISNFSEDIIASSPPPSLSPQNSLRRRTLGGLEILPIPSHTVQKGEEKMLLSPLEGKLIRQGSANTEATTEEKRRSAYVNMEELSSCNAGSLPSLNLIQKGVTITTKPSNFVEPRNYVNMQPGSSSPQLSPPATDNSSPKPSFENLKLAVVTKPSPADNYMLMGGGEQVKETHVPSLPSAVAKRPEIPPTLLSSHSHQRPVTLAAFEKLSLKEEKPLMTGVSTERSRSHSGPGAPEGTKEIISKNSEDGRASSACSSPISYSPPTSPTLGSVSSMSSLSEGGLSSASSTCTVVNVGLKHSSSASNASKSSLSTTTSVTTTATSSLTTTTSTASSVTSGACQQPSSAPEPSTTTTTSSFSSCSDSQKPSSFLSATKTVPSAAQAAAVNKPSSDDESLNYVALDLGNKSSSSSRSNKSPSPRLTSKNLYSAANKSSSDDVPLSYVEIDFNKSEGLRNTSLERDLKRPH